MRCFPSSSLRFCHGYVGRGIPPARPSCAAGQSSLAQVIRVHRQYRACDHAQHQLFVALEGLTTAVQSLQHTIEDVARHVCVGFGCQFDEPGAVAHLFHSLGEIQRIDRDAVVAQARVGGEFHKAER